MHNIKANALDFITKRAAQRMDGSRVPLARRPRGMVRLPQQVRHGVRFNRTIYYSKTI